MKSITLKLLAAVATATLVFTAVAAATTYGDIQSFPLDRVRITGGIFKEKQDIDREYLLGFMTQERTDRLLAEFRRVAGLPEKAKRYEGRWEGGGINGHSLGHYLTALSACYAVTRAPAAKERVDYIVDELAACQAANGDGYVMTIPQSNVWDKVRSGDFKASGFSICDWWVPNYTIHKVFAGLRDAFRWTGSTKALEVERRLGDWYADMISGLDDAQMQHLLKSEWGGLNETFADLAADTGDIKFLEIAKIRFDDRAIFDPLRRGEDRLDGKHANTQMPKITGLAAIYEMTGDKSARRAVETYWDSVANKRTLANGGHSDSEHFYPMKDAPRHLGPQTFETCNINNMHRLSSHMFRWKPDSRIADFVERSLVNQLVANIGEKPGEFGYFMSTKPVAEKVFSSPEGAWWCCVGTGMENPMRYAEQAFFHDNTSLWVNLYIPSTLDWHEKGVSLRLDTRFPEDGEVIIHVTAQKPVKFALRLRKPAWCDEPTLDGSAAKPDETGYIVIDREWRDESVVRLDFPISFYREELPNSDGNFVAFFRGPCLLVGITPPEPKKPDYAKVRWDDHLAAPAGTSQNAHILIRENLKDGTLPDGVQFMPFHKVYEEHYTMYFPVMAAADWEREREAIERAAADAAARAERTIDEIQPGFQQSEVNHDYAGNDDETGEYMGEKFRRAKGKHGRFSYFVSIKPNGKNKLFLKFHRNDWKDKGIIEVDGEPIQTITFNEHGLFDDGSKFLKMTIPLPESVTKGKDKVKLEFFTLSPAKRTPALYSIRVEAQ